jgi:hypothetical protein
MSDLLNIYLYTNNAITVTVMKRNAGFKTTSVSHKLELSNDSVIAF